MIGTALRRTAGTAFDPSTMGWAHWWEAKNIVAADGATSFTWTDTVTGANLANLSGTQIYRASAATLNSMAAVEFASSGMRRYDGATVTHPRSFVYINDYDAGHAIKYRTQPYNDWVPSFPRMEAFGSADHRHDIAWATGTGPKLAIFVYLGASGTKVAWDAKSNSITASANNISYSRRDLQATNVTSNATRFGLFAEYAGDITAHADYANFRQWAATTYGVTIA